MSLFQIGQRVVCIRTEPWISLEFEEVFGPGFGTEWTVAEITRSEHPPLFPRSDISTFFIRLSEWYAEIAYFGELNFRPLDPLRNLRSLLTKVPNFDTENV